MRKRKSNWTIVLIVGILFVIIGTITYLTHSYILSSNTKNDINKTTNNKDNNNEQKEEPKEKNTDTKDNKESKEKEDEKTENFKDQEGNDVKISGDKIVSATGFAGASNYKFYLRSNTLYFRNISDEDSKEEIIATGVKDLYLENKEVTAELLPEGKIVQENNYITYK